MNQYPKVTFYNDLDHLANYLCYLAKQIACGWYQDRRFLILPKLVEKEARTIFFPNLAYSQKFWQFFEKYAKDDFDFYFPEEIVTMAKELLEEDCFVSCAPRNDISKQWQNIEENFFKTLTEFLPKLDLNKINKIECLISPFGTGSSFFFEHKNGKYNFYHTLRIDTGVAHLAETIISQLMWNDHPTPKLSLWYQIEAATDFIMQYSKIGQVFDFNYVPTVSNLPELPTNLVLESEKYLEKLGFPVKPLQINAHFTPTEKRIYDGLTLSKGQTVTYDQIGDWFWGEEATEKYSLYSIAKIMEKIRKKIKDTGVYQELIFTIRGQGYVVYG